MYITIKYLFLYDIFNFLCNFLVGWSLRVQITKGGEERNERLLFRQNLFNASTKSTINLTNFIYFRDFTFRFFEAFYVQKPKASFHKTLWKTKSQILTGTSKKEILPLWDRKQDFRSISKAKGKMFPFNPL